MNNVIIPAKNEWKQICNEAREYAGLPEIDIETKRNLNRSKKPYEPNRFNKSSDEIRDVDINKDKPVRQFIPIDRSKAGSAVKRNESRPAPVRQTESRITKTGPGRGSGAGAGAGPGRGKGK
jgi:hypothetical protein